DLDVEIAALIAALGGAADHAGTAGCPTAYCMGDGTHPGGARQQQIGKEAALAFFEDVLRGDRKARRYLATLAARNPDVMLRAARGSSLRELEERALRRRSRTGVRSTCSRTTSSSAS